MVRLSYQVYAPPNLDISLSLILLILSTAAFKKVVSVFVSGKTSEDAPYQ